MGISLKNAVLSSLALVEVVAAAGLAGFVLADDTLVPVSTAVSPRVAYDVTKQGDALVVVVAVEPFSSAASPQEPAGGVAVQLGAAADKKVVLTGEKPTQDADGSVRFTFRIPAERLVTSPAGWETLRLAFAVEWAGGPAGQPRQRERFLASAARSPHAGLPPEPAD
ncbi:MAG: hypothetical protein ACKO6E_07785, partial [Planctomycetota bacterium]